MDEEEKEEKEEDTGSDDKTASLLGSTCQWPRGETPKSPIELQPPAFQKGLHRGGIQYQPAA
jgi:hypothetical protein